jgi:hypothetical protein
MLADEANRILLLGYKFALSNENIKNNNSVAFRLSDRRLSAKLVPTFADRGCSVVSATIPTAVNLGFLDRNNVKNTKRKSVQYKCTGQHEFYPGLISFQIKSDT